MESVCMSTCMCMFLFLFCPNWKIWYPLSQFAELLFGTLVSNVLRLHPPHSHRYEPIHTLTHTKQHLKMTETSLKQPGPQFISIFKEHLTENRDMRSWGTNRRTRPLRLDKMHLRDASGQDGGMLCLKLGQVPLRCDKYLIYVSTFNHPPSLHACADSCCQTRFCEVSMEMETHNNPHALT